MTHPVAWERVMRDIKKYLIAIPPRFVFILHLFYTLIYQKWLILFNLCEYTDFGPDQDSPGMLSLRQL